MNLLTLWRTDEAWRNDFASWVAREVSKTGGLDSHLNTLRELAGELTTAEVVWLYDRIRATGRPEIEWRGQFLKVFPDIVPTDLPPPLIDEAEERRQSEAAREQALKEFGSPDPNVAADDIPF